MIRTSSRQLLAPLVAAFVAATLTVPPAVAAPGDEPGGDELEQAEEELADAQQGLDELRRRIDEVEAEVAAADAQLAVLQGELAVVTQQLEEARAEAEAASAEVADARQQLQASDDELRTAEDAWQQARTALEARVAATWMHGPTAANDVLVRGLVAAEDLHDVALVRRASERLLDHDRQLVETAVAASEAAAEARAEAQLQQQTVALRAGDAYAAEDRAEQLLARQQQLIADAASTRAARRAALQRIEQDADARAALVDRLETRVSELRFGSLEEWLQQVEQIPFDGPLPAWADRLPAAGGRIAPAIAAGAARGGVDGRLMAALVWTESSFNHDAVSPAGAIGLAQLMPGTAAGLGVDPYDPLQNLVGGARYLRTQLDRFGRGDLALAAYNAGPARVVDAGYEVPDIVETQLYVLRVMDRWESLG